MVCWRKAQPSSWVDLVIPSSLPLSWLLPWEKILMHSASVGNPFHLSFVRRYLPASWKCFCELIMMLLNRSEKPFNAQRDFLSAHIAKPLLIVSWLPASFLCNQIDHPIHRSFDLSPIAQRKLSNHFFRRPYYLPQPQLLILLSPLDEFLVFGISLTPWVPRIAAISRRNFPLPLLLLWLSQPVQAFHLPAFYNVDRITNFWRYQWPTDSACFLASWFAWNGGIGTALIDSSPFRIFTVSRRSEA